MKSNALGETWNYLQGTMSRFNMKAYVDWMNEFKNMDEKS
jgi:hypothetical protein